MRSLSLSSLNNGCVTITTPADQLDGPVCIGTPWESPQLTSYGGFFEKVKGSAQKIRKIITLQLQPLT